MAIPQAATLNRADPEMDPVCLVIDQGEIGLAERLWEAMSHELAPVKMSIEADQRSGGARAVLLFSRAE